SAIRLASSFRVMPPLSGRRAPRVNPGGPVRRGTVRFEPRSHEGHEAVPELPARREYSRILIAFISGRHLALRRRTSGHRFVPFVTSWFKIFSGRSIPKASSVSTPPAPDDT